MSKKRVKGKKEFPFSYHNGREGWIYEKIGKNDEGCKPGPGLDPDNYSFLFFIFLLTIYSDESIYSRTRLRSIFKEKFS